MAIDVLSLRAIVLQALLLAVAVAIESYVLFRRLRMLDNQFLSPKQSIQYALSINLLSTVLGWFTIFSFFGFESSLSPAWTSGLETALLNFIFFNQFSTQSLSLLVVAGFIAFFANFVVKQMGVWGLRWLLQPEFLLLAKPIDPEPERVSISGIRNLRNESSFENNSLNVTPVLFANAWSHTAILLILLLINLWFSSS
jgi:hypothetical protein